jgi:hypothetical protein
MDSEQVHRGYLVQVTGQLLRHLRQRVPLRAELNLHPRRRKQSQIETRVGSTEAKSTRGWRWSLHLHTETKTESAHPTPSPLHPNRNSHSEAHHSCRRASRVLLHLHTKAKTESVHPTPSPLHPNQNSHNETVQISTCESERPLV